jgi:hypothetical protein
VFSFIFGSALVVSLGAVENWSQPPNDPNAKHKIKLFRMMVGITFFNG